MVYRNKAMMHAYTRTDLLPASVTITELYSVTSIYKKMYKNKLWTEHIIRYIWFGV